MVLGLASAAYGQTSTQGWGGDGAKSTVKGSRHDMTRPRGKDGTTPNFVGATALCEFCHAPHKFNAVAGGAPPLLWNITMKYGTDFKPYTSSSMRATDIRNPGSASSSTGASYYTLLCLSCHDGAATSSTMYQAPAYLNGATGDMNATFHSITKSGVGLADDHPVDFTYGSALAGMEDGLVVPDSTGPVATVGIARLPLFKDNAGDSAGRVECATCHNPHNDTLGMFLRTSNENSAMCINCHG